MFLGLIGGIIAYFVLRNDEPNKAKNCLYLGITLGAIGVLINLFFTDYSTIMPDSININID